MKSKQALQSEIKRNKRAVLLVNAQSRKGMALFERARILLEEKGVTLTASYAVRNGRELAATIPMVMATKPTLLILGSGDGTVSEIVDHLAYSDTVLGLLPLGTTNNFARSLDLPIGLSEAVDTIVGGKVVDIDLGKANDDYFANVLSIGVSVNVATDVSSKLKRRYGRLAYVLTGIKALAVHRPFKVDLDDGHNQRSFVTHQVVVANGRFHGGTLIALDASIDNGELVVFHLGASSRLQLVSSMAGFAFGRKRTLSDDNFLTTNSVTIQTRPVRKVEIDGEVKMTTPIAVSVATDALKIMVPKSFIDS